MPAYVPILPALLLAALTFAVPGAYAQTSSPASQSTTFYHIAAEDDVLWLARVTAGRSSVLRRERGGAFDAPREAARPIARMIAVQRGLFAVFTDGAVYRYRADRPDASPERDVPNHRTPLSLAAADGQLYALLPAVTDPESSDGTAPARISAYDGRDWQTVATCEIAAAGDPAARMRPRILVIGDFFLLVWSDSSGRLQVASRALRANAWTPTVAPEHSDLAAFWLETVNVAPTLIAAAPDQSDGEKLLGWRLTLSESGQATWHELGWRTAAPPSGGRITRFDAAAGFNQQLALLARDEGGAPCLVFARDRAEPSEAAIDVSAVYEAPVRAARRHELVRILTFLVLVLVVIGMFVFRRDSMTETFALPPRLTLAFSFQRLLASAIDMAPFAWSAALVCNVDPLAAVRDLSAWGLLAGADSQLPAAPILIWWALTAGGFTLYCGIMEAALGRTIGKLLVGTRVAAQQGRRPTLAQAAVRNALRLVELAPQFWVFAFLIILSRNRQRLGDVFARTVVVRMRSDANPASREDSGGES